MSQCLRQFDLLRPLRRPVAVPNPDEPSHTAAHEGWNSQELFCSSSFQIIPKIAGCIRIMFHIFARDRRSGKKQLAKARILLPRCRILDEWMLRIGLREICALGPGA